MVKVTSKEKEKDAQTGPYQRTGKVQGGNQRTPKDNTARHQCIIAKQ